MKLSLSVLALALLASSSSTSYVSGQDLGVFDEADVGGTRGFRVLKKDNKKDDKKATDDKEATDDTKATDDKKDDNKNDKKDKNKNNNDNQFRNTVPVGEGGIAESKQCESDLTRTYAFIDAVGHAEKGSMACYEDPVGGCGGGCCRIGSVYFICDTDNTSTGLPCVCNDLTTDVLVKQEVESFGDNTDAPTDEEESVGVETLELPYEPILVAVSDAPTEDFETMAPTE